MGRTIAVLSADVRAAASGRLLAQGRHTKFLPNTELSAEAQSDMAAALRVGGGGQGGGGEQQQQPRPKL